MSDETTKLVAVRKPAWDLLVSVAAPVGVAVSGASYLCGYTFRGMLLNEFGIAPGVIEMSVQDNIAFGYLPLVLTIIIGFGVSWIARKLISKTMSLLGIHRKRTEQFSERASTEAGRRVLFATLSVTLLVAAAAGGLWAELEAARVYRLIDDGCRRECSLVRTTRGSFHGIALVQSKDVAIFASPKTTYIIASTDLLSVTRPSRKGAFIFHPSRYLGYAGVG